MRRREFLALSVAVCFPAVSLFAAPSIHVLVDTRLPASLRFGAAAARAGASSSRFAGDLTALWRDDLQHRWRAGRGEMTGITTERGLLCLEQLAGDHRWRVGMRRSRADGLVQWTLVPGEPVMRVPPGLREADFRRALAEFERVVGAQWGVHERRRPRPVSRRLFALPQ